ncbi:class I SAM-dependent RNA methyltransferase [Bartonella tamiae]|uniref:23S rRNA (Uracil-5-)-methyltransferase RumA n=1 Tax=Bartonella tamiae Th239 TaxID=1094558 RepID=J0QWW9_9HYPH|nr:class I SAM-dependent RNA methyltransferase [Bartonella tamiae]EJF90526.1 hypothetical protein ME5_00927 [Bartonella tamiae Th239]EJF93530.1 hypothetical protein MEG_00954 [Bartonella tamiae Th307]
MNERVKIDHVGANGDGVAKTAKGAVYVPFTLPQEVANIVRLENRADVVSLIHPSQERIDPACKHFEECGGCALQHWKKRSYEAWKRALVQDALNGRKLEGHVASLVSCEPQSRRRMTLSARTTPKGQIVGYNRAFSHRIISIQECPVLHPQLVSNLENLRALCAILINHAKKFHVTVTLVDNGLDVAFSDCTVPDEATRLRLVKEALRQELTRLSIEDEIIVERQKPKIHFGTVDVEFAAGRFLQATQHAESVMGDLVLNGLKKSKNVVDLFSGSGSFTFRLAQKMNVHAVESDGVALNSLDRAMRNASNLKTITYEKRDLFRRPLTAKELERFDGVVFDPPRAGAQEQVFELAKTSIPRIVAVSCNPVTFARDLSILVDGGYKIEKTVPIDQFLWSPHVEAIAVLTKRKQKPGWRL